MFIGAAKKIISTNSCSDAGHNLPSWDIRVGCSIGQHCLDNIHRGVSCAVMVVIAKDLGNLHVYSHCRLKF